MSGPPVIVAWQPVLTDHMSYTLEELGRVAGAEVEAVVTAREDSIRRDQGWTAAQTSTISFEVLPARGWLHFILRHLRRRRVATHVFGSPFGNRRIQAGFFLALLQGHEVFLVSEPYSPVSSGYFDDTKRLSAWLRSKLRPTVYRVYGALMRRRVAGVFAISPLAAKQFRRIGIPVDKVFPFGYFVPRVTASDARGPLVTDSLVEPLRVVFVGSLIARKGIGKLVAAMEQLHARGVAVRLDVYGPGDPERVPVRGDATRYRGCIPFGQAQDVISSYDVLVLPSLHDGWGVVVNEALLAGVPVACSAGVGAGAVVRKWSCGWIFDVADVPGIASLLETLALDRGEVALRKQRARDVSQLLEPAVAAQYMWEAMGAARSGKRPPDCPWY